jgi:hypothetical protein
VFGENHGFSPVELVKNPVSLVCAIALLGLMGDRLYEEIAEAGAIMRSGLRNSCFSSGVM